MISPKYGVRCLKVGFQRYRRYCKLPVSIELSPNTVSFYLKKPSEERGKNARVSNHHLSMERYANKNEPWLSDNISIEFIVPNSEEDKKELRARVYQNAEGSIKPFDVTTYQYNSNVIEPNDIIDIFKAIIAFLDGLGYSDPFVNDPKKAAKILSRSSNIKPYKPMSTNISVDKDGNYVFANGDGVDFVSESRMRSIIRESINNLLLTESQESKSIDAAKKLAMQILRYNEQKADKFVRVELRGIIPSLKTPEGGKFILGVTRMYCNRELVDARTISRLNTTLKYVASDAHINEYDRNLNGMSAQDLISRFAKNVEMDLENDRNEVGSMQFNGNSDYDIVRIDSFEQAKEYNKYTYPKDQWCLTYKDAMYNEYTCRGINQIYFCLKKGFENTRPIKGENTPLDEYGLSMISVIVDEKGALSYSTCRWNHSNDGNDNIMTTKQISEVIGMNFYDVFKPNNKWNEMVENATQRLANGEDPKDVFDWCDYFYDGYARVKLVEKMNFINQNGEFLSDHWFDRCSDFYNGFAKVNLNGKCNFIDQNGKILYGDEFSTVKWFDYCDYFSDGFARIKLNKKWNFINQDGEIAFPNQWLDSCSEFSEGFAKVQLRGEWYYIDKEGNITKEKPQVSESRINDIIRESIMNYIKMDTIK